MEHAITVDGLTKHYKDFSLQDVTFSVPHGSIMGFIGENGAGKTTTIKAILGLLHTDAGSVQVLGKSPLTQRKEIGMDLGAVLDGGFFSEGLRPRDISAVMARLHPRWNAAQFATDCGRFSLPMTKPAKEFSKGMKAKLALVTALSHAPKLLILDEPTSGLDPVVRSEMLDIFQAFIEDETHSILLSSHITSDLERIADSITFLHAGKIVFSKTTLALQEQYAIVTCAAGDVARLPAAVIAGRRDSRFDTALLVSNALEVRRAYPRLLLETAKMDDIMTFFAKEHAV